MGATDCSSGNVIACQFTGSGGVAEEHLPLPTTTLHACVNFSIECVTVKFQNRT